MVVPLIQECAPIFSHYFWWHVLHTIAVGLKLVQYVEIRSRSTHSSFYFLYLDMAFHFENASCLRFYLWSAHQYFRFIFHRMLYSQWKWISYCSRYVYSFEVCPTKCLLYIFGYGFLRWRWKFSRVIWGMCNYIFALLLVTGYIHNVSWFQIGQGMYIRSTYAHSNIQYLLLVMAF